PRFRIDGEKPILNRERGGHEDLVFLQRTQLLLIVQIGGFVEQDAGRFLGVIEAVLPALDGGSDETYQGIALVADRLLRREQGLALLLVAHVVQQVDTRWEPLQLERDWLVAAEAVPAI